MPDQSSDPARCRANIKSCGYQQGRPARPRLTAILDDFNGAVAGYAVNLGAPWALQTALASRQAIWREADPPWTVCSS